MLQLTTTKPNIYNSRRIDPHPKAKGDCNEYYAHVEARVLGGGFSGHDRPSERALSGMGLWKPETLNTSFRGAMYT
jgi:hypothetical protein